MSGIVGSSGADSGLIGLVSGMMTENIWSGGYMNIGNYRLLLGNGTPPTSQSQYTNGAAGINYYTSTGLQVSLTGFSAMYGAIGVMKTDYVEVVCTINTLTTSECAIRTASSRGNASWASPYVIYYLIWGAHS